MPLEWSGWSPDLLVPLDRDAAEPLRTQLETSLRDGIRSGRLTAGERLPSTRRLAEELGVSRGLVQECYRQLQAEGYLVGRVGSATTVAPGAQESPRAVDPARPPEPPLTVDFVPGLPDLGGFPRADWLWAMRDAARAAPNALLGYGDPRGAPELRAVLAGYLRRVRAAATEPAGLVICNGFAQGLTLVLHALAGNGVRRVAVEDPGYSGAEPEAFAFAGTRAVPVPVDERGIRVDALAATGVRAVILSPAHQWPTGVVLAPERRHALVEWARAADAFIIEDDYDAEFRYDRDPVGALQGLAPDRVALIGTVSKSLAPALRIGWVACPPSLVDAVATGKEHSDRGSPALDQLALAGLIESGRFDKHLRRMRIAYAARRTALAEALATHAPMVTLTGLAAGFHAIAHLPPTVDEASLVHAARARSVGLYGMSAHRSDRAPDPPQLVLGFGNLGERAVHQGIATIADLLRG